MQLLSDLLLHLASLVRISDILNKQIIGRLNNIRPSPSWSHLSIQRLLTDCTLAPFKSLFFDRFRGESISSLVPDYSTLDLLHLYHCAILLTVYEVNVL